MAGHARQNGPGIGEEHEASLSGSERDMSARAGTGGGDHEASLSGQERTPRKSERALERGGERCKPKRAWEVGTHEAILMGHMGICPPKQAQKGKEHCASIRGPGKRGAQSVSKAREGGEYLSN